MNDNKFTPRAEEALRLSQEAAGELGHGYVGTEHLLLGLLREPHPFVSHSVQPLYRRFQKVNGNIQKSLRQPFLHYIGECQCCQSV